MPPGAKAPPRGAPNTAFRVDSPRAGRRRLEVMAGGGIAGFHSRSGEFCRHLKIAGWIVFFMISSGYQSPSAKVATQPLPPSRSVHSSSHFSCCKFCPIMKKPLSLRKRAFASSAMAVWCLAAVLLLAAGSPSLQAQDDTAPVGTESFLIPDRGGTSTTSNGNAETLREGYGRIRADAGSTTPSGIAIFQFRDNEGVLISEAGVPAAAPVREGRIFAEVNGPINTGLAIANPNDVLATIRFYFTDTSGTRFADGSFELGAHQQRAEFLNQATFNGGPSVLGTFTFTSSVPVAVVALRGFTNEAGEFLMTTLPVAPLVGPPSPFSRTPTDTVYFPHFADGNGWETQVILVNPTDRAITGMVGFLEPGSGAVAASPVVLALDNGSTGSDFDYSIPPRSVQMFTTSNPTGRLAVGSVRATPSSGNAAPSGLVVFSFAPDGKTVSEAGVPALPKGSAFRVYVEASGTPEQVGLDPKRTGHRQHGRHSEYGDPGGDRSGWIAGGRSRNAIASTLGSDCPFYRRHIHTAGQLCRSAPGHFLRRDRSCWTEIADQRKRRTEGNDNISIERDGSFDLGG